MPFTSLTTTVDSMSSRHNKTTFATPTTVCQVQRHRHRPIRTTELHAQIRHVVTMVAHMHNSTKHDAWCEYDWMGQQKF